MLRSLLILNGVFPPLEWLEQLRSLACIAADGAGQRLIAMGYSPQLIIGDGDSFKSEHKDKACEFIIKPDQESTDFEKCLNEMAKRKHFPALVCGIGGGEIDHQHENLNVFVKYAKKYPMIFIDIQEGFKAKLGLAVQNELEVKITKGSHVSLLPFPKALVTTQGLVWPLTNEVLTMLKRSGARNKALEPDIKISKASGDLLVVLDLNSLQGLYMKGLSLDEQDLSRIRF